MKHLNQSGGFLGGVFGGQNSNSGSGVVTPGGLGTIGGGMTSIPRPNRPFFGRPRTGGPTPVGTVGTIAGQYANASGSCSLWMCSNDEY